MLMWVHTGGISTEDRLPMGKAALSQGNISSRRTIGMAVPSVIRCFTRRRVEHRREERKSIPWTSSSHWSSHWASGPRVAALRRLRRPRWKSPSETTLHNNPRNKRMMTSSVRAVRSTGALVGRRQMSTTPKMHKASENWAAFVKQRPPKSHTESHVRSCLRTC